jgi:hypothetical protein
LTAGLGSYGAANAVFFGLCVLLCLGRISRHWAIAGLIAASFLWAAAGLWLAWTPGGSASIYGALDLARGAALLFLLNDALRRLSGAPGDISLSERMGVLAPAAALMAIGLASLRLLEMENALFFGLIGHVAIAVCADGNDDSSCTHAESALMRCDFTTVTWAFVWFLHRAFRQFPALAMGTARSKGAISSSCPAELTATFWSAN